MGKRFWKPVVACVLAGLLAACAGRPGESLSPQEAARFRTTSVVVLHRQDGLSGTIDRSNSTRGSTGGGIVGSLTRALLGPLIDGITDSNREDDMAERVKPMQPWFDMNRYYQQLAAGVNWGLSETGWAGGKYVRIERPEGNRYGVANKLDLSDRDGVLAPIMQRDPADAVAFVSSQVFMSPDFSQMYFTASFAMFPNNGAFLKERQKAGRDELPDPLYAFSVPVYEHQLIGAERMEPDRNIARWLDNRGMQLQEALARGAETLSRQMREKFKASTK